ncbi:hypothetical protein JEQ12_008633 [Ovis aries]|uniref:Uncharacterized protein n=1 Tax=Ovis aries TaxID=9940 RepID=A0A836CUD8_SHEEP|nr:hypothetical protein JEQ12_008633 [Ovis aries]
MAWGCLLARAKARHAGLSPSVCQALHEAVAMGRKGSAHDSRRAVRRPEEGWLVTVSVACVDPGADHRGAQPCSLGPEEACSALSSASVHDPQSSAASASLPGLALGPSSRNGAWNRSSDGFLSNIPTGLDSSSCVLVLGSRQPPDGPCMWGKEEGRSTIAKPEPGKGPAVGFQREEERDQTSVHQRADSGKHPVPGRYRRLHRTPLRGNTGFPSPVSAYRRYLGFLFAIQKSAARQTPRAPIHIRSLQTCAFKTLNICVCGSARDTGRLVPPPSLEGSKEPPGHPEESAVEGRRPPGGGRVRVQGGSHVGAGRAHPAPSAVVGPACAYCSLCGARHGTDPACRPDRRAPWLEFPDPVVPAGGPFANHPWMRYPPSVWAWGVCSFDPLVGSQPSGPWFPRVFPYPVGPHPHTPHSFQLLLRVPQGLAQIGCVGASTRSPGPPGCFLTLWSPHPHTPRPLQLQDSAGLKSTLIDANMTTVGQMLREETCKKMLRNIDNVACVRQGPPSCTSSTRRPEAGTLPKPSRSMGSPRAKWTERSTGKGPVADQQPLGLQSASHKPRAVKSTPAGASEPHADMWEGERCWGPFLLGEASVELGVPEGTSKLQLTRTLQLGG